MPHNGNDTRDLGESVESHILSSVVEADEEGLDDLFMGSFGLSSDGAGGAG